MSTQAKEARNRIWHLSKKEAEAREEMRAEIRKCVMAVDLGFLPRRSMWPMRQDMIRNALEAWGCYEGQGDPMTYEDGETPF